MSPQTGFPDLAHAVGVLDLAHVARVHEMVHYRVAVLCHLNHPLAFRYLSYRGDICLSLSTIGGSVSIT